MLLTHTTTCEKYQKIRQAQKRASASKNHPEHKTQEGRDLHPIHMRAWRSQGRKERRLGGKGGREQPRIGEKMGEM